MEIQSVAPETLVKPELQDSPDGLRYHRCLADGCNAIQSVQHWLKESERAQESLDRAREERDAIVKELIAGNPRAQELENFLKHQQRYADLAQDELAFHKQKARQSFAAADAANPEAGKRMLDGRVSISIRRSAVGHWDPEAAAKAGKELVKENPLLFDTLFASVKQGFKKLIGMGIRVSPDVMRIDETVVVNFRGGDEMIRQFRSPFSRQETEEPKPAARAASQSLIRRCSGSIERKARRCAKAPIQPSGTEGSRLTCSGD